ncbi:hypothetical protein SteCoe_25770 [Stentor coeruleus]|uniref:RING-type domain-containing protein n=1 Tax=Stentor coeruleus TaxID=5963 RepID=A0A1R2BEE8_9CILI|nr:hypothetical protein SteCoe_25770 [Stentor coeruleus]
MSRHSKNNTAHSIFTQGEKQMIKDWGTIKQRLGAESFREANACCLCLKAASNPMACSKGHLFCKECIYTNVLTQKSTYKQELLNWKLSQKKQNNNSIVEDQKKLRFEAAENGLLGQESWEKFENDRKYTLMSEEKRVQAKAKAYLQSKEKRLASKQELIEKSFWVPEKTPDEDKVEVKKPMKTLKCPEGNHEISIKTLKTIRVEVDPKTSLFLCCSCFNPFTHQCALLMPCGHVFCSSCTPPEVNSCLKCATSFEKKNIIKLAGSGTMFSAHNQVEAKITKPVFQC